MGAAKKVGQTEPRRRLVVLTGRAHRHGQRDVTQTDYPLAASPLEEEESAGVLRTVTGTNLLAGVRLPMA